MESSNQTPNTAPSDLLASHLADLRGSGENAESNVSFSVRIEALIERYALFEAELQGYYLLRLAQGFHLIEAVGVEIATARSTVQLRVACFAAEPPPWLAPDQLLLLLGDPLNWNRAQNAICTALLAAAGTPKRELTWCWGGKALVAKEGAFEVLRADVAVEDLVITVSKLNTGWITEVGVEHALCLQRLPFARIPITIDTLALKPNAPPPDRSATCWSRELGDSFHLAEVITGGPAPADWEDDYGPGDPSRHWAKFVWYTQPEQRACRMVIDGSLSGDSFIVPLIDGVTGEAFAVCGLPGMKAYIDASDLKTDLSGFSVIEKEVLLEQASELYLGLLRKVRGEVNGLSATWSFSYPDYPLSGVLGVALSFGGELALLGLPVLGVTLGLEAAASGLVHTVMKESRTTSLRQGLEARISALLDGSEQTPTPSA